MSNLKVQDIETKTAIKNIEKRRREIGGAVWWDTSAELEEKSRTNELDYCPHLEAAIWEQEQKRNKHLKILMNNVTDFANRNRFKVLLHNKDSLIEFLSFQNIEGKEVKLILGNPSLEFGQPSFQIVQHKNPELTQKYKGSLVNEKWVIGFIEANASGFTCGSSLITWYEYQQDELAVKLARITLIADEKAKKEAYENSPEGIAKKELAQIKERETQDWLNEMKAKRECYEAEQACIRKVKSDAEELDKLDKIRADEAEKAYKNSPEGIQEELDKMDARHGF
ncbi:MAG: hypothetical protein WCJ11_10095 [Methylococcaceae bacterium]